MNQNKPRISRMNQNKPRISQINADKTEKQSGNLGDSFQTALLMFSDPRLSAKSAANS